METKVDGFPAVVHKETFAKLGSWIFDVIKVDARDPQEVLRRVSSADRVGGGNCHLQYFGFFEAYETFIKDEGREIRLTSQLLRGELSQMEEVRYFVDIAEVYHLSVLSQWRKPRLVRDISSYEKQDLLRNMNERQTDHFVAWSFPVRDRVVAYRPDFDVLLVRSS